MFMSFARNIGNKYDKKYLIKALTLVNLSKKNMVKKY